MKLPSQSQKRLHLCHQVQFALFYVGLFNPKQWEASPELRPPIRESRSLLLALTSMKLGCASGPAARCGRARARGISRICSICKCRIKLFKALSAGPTRACLPLRSSAFSCPSDGCSSAGVFGRFWCLLF